MMYTKLQQVGKSLLWILGLSVIIAQTYRVVAFYGFDVPMDIQWDRDLPLFIFGISLMYIQNGVKTLARKLLSKTAEMVGQKKK